MIRSIGRPSAKEQAMQRPPASRSGPVSTGPGPGLFGVLRGLAEQMKRASGADLVSLYLYDVDTQTYYAPLTLGLPEDDLLGSLSDMQDQLARYLADAAQGKAPVELQPKHYGPNVWLTITRRVLLALDAPNELDSSFIRRHHVHQVVGLPLIAGDTLVGLLYLNFCAKAGTAKRAAPRVDPAKVAELEQAAGQAALAIERAREAEERAAFVTAGALAAQLVASTAEIAADGDGPRRQLNRALNLLLESTGFEAAVAYQLGTQPGYLDLVSQQGLPTAPASIDLFGEAPSDQSPGSPTAAAPTWDPTGNEAVRRALETTGLHAVATLPLGRAERLHGWLVILSRDRLALRRKAPAVNLLLQTTADQITGTLLSQQLIVTLEETNRVLGALSRMSRALLQPGATQQQVLEAVVRHLTDAQVPEFDFQFASVFLLDEASGGGAVGGAGEPAPLVVRTAAGAAPAASIDASPVGDEQDAAGAGLRVPRWTQTPNRTLLPGDVLGYVARTWQVVVVGAGPGAGEGAAPTNGGGDFISGYPVDELHALQVPAVRSDGSTSALIPAILVGEPGALGPASSGGREAAAVPFTLDGDIYEASRHRDLVRVFVPFGLDAGQRATGVLEAGYHREHKRHLERPQVEAVRAGAAQVAVAVETARLYEDVKRHVEQLEITTDVSKAIASSIELDQTLRLVARNLVRLVDASLCQIALLDQEGSAWSGAAASDEEELWRRQRGERPETSFLFDVFDRRAPLVIDDAQTSDLVSPYYAKLFGIRSLLALPLVADDQPIGVAVLAQRDRPRRFTAEEVQRATGLAHQAAIALKNARLHAYSEEERHIQKDVVLLGYGQWGRRAYNHLLTLKQFFNFKTHVVVPWRPGKEEELAAREQEVVAKGDAFYLDRPESPAREQIRRALESSCYVITYIATPAATHLPVLAEFYDLSNVVVIEKPLGASPEAYRAFLDGVDGGVEIVAADHYYFKLEVRLLQLLLTEERTLKTFVENVEEIELELLEEQPLTGAAAEIGIIADMLPHAFAIVSLFTPIDRIRFVNEPAPLLLGRQEPLHGDKETYARITATFPLHGRSVRLIITTGKGVETAKWIKLSGEQRRGGRRPFYKFDFVNGVAVDGTQTNLRAAVRAIREPGVPDNAHLTMLRHVIEKRHPAVGILAIREAMRSNQRIQELEAMAEELLSHGVWTPYRQGQRPVFPAGPPLRWMDGGRAVEEAAIRQAD
jgi:GAF domain-containing protein